MRCDMIGVTYKIPVPVNVPDGNGILYTVDAVKNACLETGGHPITQINIDGSDTVLGYTTQERYDNGFIYVDGYLWHGGTTESVEYEDGKVVSMKIESLSICV